jgi:hypothetical protein
MPRSGAVTLSDVISPAPLSLLQRTPGRLAVPIESGFNRNCETAKHDGRRHRFRLEVKGDQSSGDAKYRSN